MYVTPFLGTMTSYTCRGIGTVCMLLICSLFWCLSTLSLLIRVSLEMDLCSLPGSFRFSLYLHKDATLSAGSGATCPFLCRRTALCFRRNRMCTEPCRVCCPSGSGSGAAACFSEIILLGLLTSFFSYRALRLFSCSWASLSFWFRKLSSTMSNCSI